MKSTLRPQINDNPAAAAALEILQEIQRRGFSAYFVGGGVRDMLMGRSPKDIDIATSAHPENLQQWFKGCMLVGAKFGVVLIPYNGISVEVATFREEGIYHDRRRPDLVRFSSLDRDAQRRDFTCNALYYDPVADEIVDMVGGVNDISGRVLRTVGLAKDRFSEDALRVLRAVRFAANLGFNIEPATWEAVRECASFLREISMERVRDEILNGLCGEDPARFLDLLDASGIIKLFLPEVSALHGCEQPPEYHPEGDVYVHTKLMFSLLKSNPTPSLAMAVLLHDIAKPPTQTFEDRIRFNSHDKIGAEMALEICRRLRMSNHQTDRVATMVRRHMQFINLQAMRKSTLKRFLASPTIEDELELHRVDCLASHGNLDGYYFALERLEEIRQEDSDGNLPNPLITGADLIEKGLKPGPSFAKILREVFDAQLDGNVRTKDEAVKLAMEISVSV